MTFINRAKTPALILHGAADVRVAASQSQELYMGLRKNNVPVDENKISRKEPHHGLKTFCVLGRRGPPGTPMHS